MSRLWPFISIVAVGALLGWLASRCFARLSLQLRAARTLGASEWRIFWRVIMPAAWLQIALGLLLLLTSAALVVWAVA